MYIVILCSLICLFLTYRDSIGKMNDGMKWGFVIVTLLGAIHYDYGNDYMPYYQGYLDIERLPFNFKAIMAGDYYREPGWAMLLWCSRYIGGFFSLVAVLNIVQNLIIYQSIKKYVERKWWPLSVFVYLFVTSFYLMEFTMMRQFLVMCVFLGMWPFMMSRKWYIPLVVLYLCSYIHSSSIVLIPFAFCGYLPVRKHRVIGIMYVAIFAILWLMGNVVGDALGYLISMNDSMENYSNIYAKREGGLNIGIGFIMYLIPIALSAYYLFIHDKKNSDEKTFLVILTSIEYLVTPFAWIIPLAGRMGMYFGIYKIVTIPYIYANIKNKNLQLILLALFIIVICYDYMKFFSPKGWLEYYSEYHTIFEVL